MMERNGNLKEWIDRTRRMIGYRDEALDFLRRASNMTPVFESDVGLVCRLWAIADELDEVICNALTEFESALFESAGELDITRGVETRPAPENDSRVVFLCAWSAARSERLSVSCALYAEQLSGEIGLEVRDSGGASRAIPYPLSDTSALYETLSDSFFHLAAGI